MIVAIDGPAGAGKSTISLCAAEKTGFMYLNSGNFYRAITLELIRKGFTDRKKIGDNIRKVISVAEKCNITVLKNHLFLDDVDVEKDLHSDDIDRLVAIHSSIPEIRRIVNDKLRASVVDRDAIVEGRDIGTIVFPDAELKIYIFANLETRARRRFLQGTSTLSLEEIKKSIAERDEIDRNKSYGRLEKASDAIILDTSDLTIEQVCEKVVKEILKRKSKYQES